MGITVKAALEIYPLSTAKVVAGAQGMDKEISFLNIIERPDVAQWMRGGELLFTSGFVIREGVDKFIEIIQQLAGKGVAALAVRPSDYLPALTPEMIRCADRVGLPLLQIDQAVPFMDYMEPLLERLVNEQLELLKTTEGIHTRLMDSMLRGGGAEGILSTLEGIIDTPVSLLDGRGRLLNKAVTPEHQALEQVFREHPKHFRVEKMPSGKYISVHINGVGDFGCIAIHGSNSRRPLLLTRENFSIPQTISILAQENAASLIAVETMSKDIANSQIYTMRGEMLEEMLERSDLAPGIRRKRAEFIGVDLTRPFGIYVMRILEQADGKTEVNSAAYGMTLVQARQVISEKLTHLLHVEGADLFLHHRADEFIILLNLDMCKPERIEETLKAAVLRQRREYPNLRLVMGCSDMMIGDGLLRKAYDQAALAARIGIRFLYGKTVIAHRQLGVFRFLDAIEDKTALYDYVQERVGALLNYKHSEEFIETLRVYFANKQNISRTAQELFVHKNTVIYRLHKVEELLGLDLDDYERVFELQFCIKAHDLLGHSRSSWEAGSADKYMN